MKRAKQRKFREPPFWIKFFHSVWRYEDLRGVDLARFPSPLISGEISHIDGAIRFIPST